MEPFQFKLENKRPRPRLGDLPVGDYETGNGYAVIDRATDTRIGYTFLHAIRTELGAVTEWACIPEGTEAIEHYARSRSEAGHWLATKHKTKERK